jgi:hypothetical protein
MIRKRKRTLSPNEVRIAKRLSKAKREPPFSETLILTFGKDKYVKRVSRKDCQFPLLQRILNDEPRLRMINFIQDEKLSELSRRGLDLLFSLDYQEIKDDPYRWDSRFPLTIISALRWAEYFNLDWLSDELPELVGSLVCDKYWEWSNDVLIETGNSIGMIVQEIAKEVLPSPYSDDIIILSNLAKLLSEQRFIIKETLRNPRISHNRIRALTQQMVDRGR